MWVRQLFCKSIRIGKFLHKIRRGCSVFEAVYFKNYLWDRDLITIQAISVFPAKTRRCCSRLEIVSYILNGINKYLHHLIQVCINMYKA